MPCKRKLLQHPTAGDDDSEELITPFTKKAQPVEHKKSVPKVCPVPHAANLFCLPTQ
jgi:hypothetical protein